MEASMNLAYFQIFLGVLTLVCALSVVLTKNPVVAAVCLMSTLFSTGLLYFGMGSFFIGAVQILIYAGAIAVLFVFIEMLIDLKPLKIQIPGRNLVIALALFSGLLLVVSLGLSVLPAVFDEGGHSPELQAQGLEAATAKAISLSFLSKYMVPFQVTGVLILGAIMGGVVLGKPPKAAKEKGT